MKLGGEGVVELNIIPGILSNLLASLSSSTCLMDTIKLKPNHSFHLRVELDGFQIDIDICLCVSLKCHENI